VPDAPDRPEVEVHNLTRDTVIRARHRLSPRQVAMVLVGVHSLLVRRASNGELAFYRCWTRARYRWPTLIAVAGRRWSIADAFQAAKTHIGLDHYQCRGWIAWHRFILLAMFALAILVITLACQQPYHVDPRHDILIALTIGELRRLAASIAPVTPAPATARRSHTNAATPPPAHRSRMEPVEARVVRARFCDRRSRFDSCRQDHTPVALSTRSMDEHPATNRAACRFDACQGYAVGSWRT
jgi:hypothetical protein